MFYHLLQPKPTKQIDEGLQQIRKRGNNYSKRWTRINLSNVEESNLQHRHLKRFKNLDQIKITETECLSKPKSSNLTHLKGKSNLKSLTFIVDEKNKFHGMNLISPPKKRFFHRVKSQVGCLSSFLHFKVLKHVTIKWNLIVGTTHFTILKPIFKSRFINSLELDLGEINIQPSDFMQIMSEADKSHALDTFSMKVVLETDQIDLEHQQNLPILKYLPKKLKRFSLDFGYYANRFETLKWLFKQFQSNNFESFQLNIKFQSFSVLLTDILSQYLTKVLKGAQNTLQKLKLGVEYNYTLEDSTLMAIYSEIGNLVKLQDLNISLQDCPKVTSISQLNLIEQLKKIDGTLKNLRLKLDIQENTFYSRIGKVGDLIANIDSLETIDLNFSSSINTQKLNQLLIANWSRVINGKLRFNNQSFRLDPNNKAENTLIQFLHYANNKNSDMAIESSINLSYDTTNQKLVTIYNLLSKDIIRKLKERNDSKLIIELNIQNEKSDPSQILPLCKIIEEAKMKALEFIIIEPELTFNDEHYQHFNKYLDFLKVNKKTDSELALISKLSNSLSQQNDTLRSLKIQIKRSYSLKLLEHLIKDLCCLDQLEELDLSSQECGIEGLEFDNLVILPQTIEEMVQLKRLYLGFKIKLSSLELLLISLQNLKNLEHFNLKYPHLEDSYWNTLIVSLGNCNALQKVQLDFDSIVEMRQLKGVEHLCQGLKEKFKMLQLDVRFKGITGNVKDIESFKQNIQSEYGQFLEGKYKDINDFGDLSRSMLTQQDIFFSPVKKLLEIEI